MRKKTLLYVLVMLSIFAALLAYKVVKWKAYVWLPDYLTQMVRDGEKSVSSPVHIMFIVADHYELGRRPDAASRNREWLAKYMAMASRHGDSYGRKPQHTWFYAYDQKNDEAMRDLAKAVGQGYGEIELHWHHSHDTNASFADKLRDALKWFNSFGAMTPQVGEDSLKSPTGSAVPKGLAGVPAGLATASHGAPATVRFGFIHGNWGLDNSRGKEYCGVTRELDILRQAGCYADFTFPSFGYESQPSKTNSIYYAMDDSASKSYDTGVDAAVGGTNREGLMVFEGPLGLILGRPLFDYGAIDIDNSPSRSRVDSWIARNIHVKGRPEWIFVKVYTHGVWSQRVFLGKETDDMFTYLEQRYGKGAYRLHYVTAREAFNIVRAAENGLSGDPDSYRNYEIREPANKSAFRDVKPASRNPVCAR
jgi:hypothetical protein